MAGSVQSRCVSQWWQRVDVTHWTDSTQESRGHRRPKMWVQAPDGGIWLRKEPPPLPILFMQDLDEESARRHRPAITERAKRARQGGVCVDEQVEP
jgi:hypothetical protein